MGSACCSHDVCLLCAAGGKSVTRIGSEEQRSDSPLQLHDGKQIKESQAGHALTKHIRYTHMQSYLAHVDVSKWERVVATEEQSIRLVAEITFSTDQTLTSTQSYSKDSCIH